MSYLLPDGSTHTILSLLISVCQENRPSKHTPSPNVSQCADLESKQQRLIFLVADFVERELDALIDAVNEIRKARAVKSKLEERAGKH